MAQSHKEPPERAIADAVSPNTCDGKTALTAAAAWASTALGADTQYVMVCGTEDFYVCPQASDTSPGKGMRVPADMPVPICTYGQTHLHYARSGASDSTVTWIEYRSV